MTSNRAFVLLAITASVGIGGHAAAAETYPVKPVRVIAAFPPGGFVDFTTRVLAGPLGTALGCQATNGLSTAGLGGIKRDVAG
ncbi:MAG: hypothetical protein A3F74_09360 [Betaproteobacteria bacterium RIFCSPLOWO2_12_FULL_62_58]|nr:MAG: hypothetical protein A3F74_09360 [Betaproteobacteria bacterium RIFCSPLOWO2_12_FULL_62_58]